MSATTLAPITCTPMRHSDNPERSLSVGGVLSQAVSLAVRRVQGSVVSLAASHCAGLPGVVMSRAVPFVAGLVRPPDVHDLDGEVTSLTEHLVRQCGPVEQTRPARAVA